MVTQEPDGRVKHDYNLDFFFGDDARELTQGFLQTNRIFSNFVLLENSKYTTNDQLVANLVSFISPTHIPQHLPTESKQIPHNFTNKRVSIYL